ncbi:XTP/dITP diphosphohydrolase [Marmoricola sp. OAE513]|uniref:MazG family protein n=1 Tax=Marmoricola sp. OAE513 TaxID=2817894 RepID=UPI001D3B52F2
MADRQESRLVELTAVMAQLRRECAWKSGQTHESLVRYLLEETYEVVEAIEQGTDDDLREELGDLLLQVFFHAAIAAEDGSYDIEDVAGDLIAKLRRRNPHVFDPGSTTVPADDAVAVNEQWEQIKALEKSREGLMDGVPEDLPALLRAVKALERLERTGRVVEVSSDSEDVGDRLLALVIESHRAGVDPEQALRGAVRRIGSAPG